MAISPLDAITVVLDVSSSMDHPLDGGGTALEASKNILSIFLQRKIFEESKDYVSLFTCGSEDSTNELTSGDDYQHISMEKSLGPVDWELCNHIQNEIASTNYQGDLIDALIVASTYLMKEICKLDSRKQKAFDAGSKMIMLLTNLDSPLSASPDELEQIIAQLKDKDINLHVIGLSDHQQNDDQPMDDDDPGEGPSTGPRNGTSSSKPKTVNQQKGEKLMMQIVEQVDGTSYSFHDAMEAMTHFSIRKKKSAAWNADLELGPSLKLSVSGYKLIKREPLPSFKPTLAKDINVDIEKKSDLHMADGTATVVTSEDVIKGYRYGTDLVPFTDDDMANMKYKCPEKSFQIIGYTKKDFVKRGQYLGDGSMVFLSRKGDDIASVAVSAFIKALYETDMVAVVRRAYAKNSAPRMGCLIPSIDETELLHYVELPFSEDLRDFEFAPLPLEDDDESKFKPSVDQFNAIDSLITDMDMSGNPDDEPLRPERTRNPNVQRLFQILQCRAESADEPMPVIPPILTNMMNIPEETQTKCETSLNKVKDLFKLEVLEEDTSKKENLYVQSDMGKENNPTEPVNQNGSGDANNILKSMNQEEITSVGTVNPVTDFQAMVKQSDISAENATKQLEKIVFELIVESIGDTFYKKAQSSIEAYRQHALNKCPDQFNTFLEELKSMLHSKGFTSFWDTLVQQSISLIDSSENPASKVTPDVKDQFFKNVEIVQKPMDTNADGDDDLLDEL